MATISRKVGEIPGIERVKRADERAGDANTRQPATFPILCIPSSQGKVPGQPDRDDGKGQGHQVGMEVAQQEAEERELVDRLGRRGRASIVDAKAVTDDAAGAPTDAGDTVPPRRRDGAGRILDQSPGSVEVARDGDREQGEQPAGRCQARAEPGS